MNFFDAVLFQLHSVLASLQVGLLGGPPPVNRNLRFYFISPPFLKYLEYILPLSACMHEIRPTQECLPSLCV